MNRFFSLLLPLVLLTTSANAQGTVTIVDRPDREQTNASYTNFRKPLQ